jgi:hypothetical protein
MTIRKIVEMESIVFVLFGALVGAVLINHLKSNQQSFHSLTNLPAMAADPTPIASPTPEFVPHMITSSQTSSDGTKKVIVEAKENKDTSKTYTVSTADGDDTNMHTIITKTLEGTNSITIPFNTWSPDNKYFFIQENKKDDTAIFVFRPAGEDFVDGAAYLDVTQAYKNMQTNFIYGETTGWASENLLIINTKLADGAQGPSYWYAVPSKAVMRLSTKF